MPATPHLHDAFYGRCVSCKSWADWMIKEKIYCDRCVPVEIPDWERRFWAGWKERASVVRRNVDAHLWRKRRRGAFG